MKSESLFVSEYAVRLEYNAGSSRAQQVENDSRGCVDWIIVSLFENRVNMVAWISSTLCLKGPI
jgi:hypothetical protein